ncbi:MAG: hypothetical protein J6V44_03645 [Methanobrevibacter sp.]|nr:hypothetical protein [Methanobrevibacter sp.]
MAENDSSSDSGKTDVVIEDVTAEATKNQNLEPIKNKANEETPMWDRDRYNPEETKISSNVPYFKIYISHQKVKEEKGQVSLDPEQKSYETKESTSE